MRRDLVLLSGGVDSTTALAERDTAGTVCHAVAVQYGQRHDQEVDAAHRIAHHYRVPLTVLDLSDWGRLLSGSLTDPDATVPTGAYDTSNMAATVVPNRNATLLMAAVGVAESHDYTHVVTAVHGGDHPVYPDCRPEFITSAAATAEWGTGGRVTIDAPFAHQSKTDIVRRAHQLHAPLSCTWSCYTGGDYHCGVCGTCTERRAAFTEAGVPDPTEYATAVSL